jgi:hypothetical protein
MNGYENMAGAAAIVAGGGSEPSQNGATHDGWPPSPPMELILPRFTSGGAR